ncbi:pleckstrin homology-like domain family B member 1 [Stomoxys calcitrans]|uniref:PH domain-containing protein n=1 Tax=Stomoxys calcitrans TaxID=35570 RepID=A0A1I8PKP6_STOCA|nr:pleckstrin homology-like domain family B member 1 [Stomoxys calcitrans]
MSLSKKDPSLRVAANDPHLVSLGGGRLSTAVTIHNIPVGDTTIGSSIDSNISLSGSGVKPLHCTIYRSEENQVTLVPEREARILIDGQLVRLEVDLKQGAMITLGDSYYLRYNNPAEAQRMRTAMGDSWDEFENDEAAILERFYENNINPNLRSPEESRCNERKALDLKPLDINGWQCPKVFAADLVTVNMPAKDVLGQKYANFAKNLAENHRKDKNVNTKNNDGLYVNIPQLKSLTDSCELLSKVQNTSTPQKSKSEVHAFDSKDYLEDMLKICTEYSDRQDRSGGSLSSSPIVQNRIKTNGSLPREKKSPFYQEFNTSGEGNNNLQASPIGKTKSSGYENVRIVGQNRIEVESTSKSCSSGYENVKFVPQSPRTKIRTNCLSPKKDDNYEDRIRTFEEQFQREIQAIEYSSRNGPRVTALSANSTPVPKRTNKNINNLTIDIKSLVSPQNSPKMNKKPAPAPRSIIKPATSPPIVGSLPNLYRNSEKLHIEREDLLRRLRSLKEEISMLQQQDNEALIEMDVENALVLGELQSLNESKNKLEQEYKVLQQRIHRLEAQRNATRVMEENQQAKLKQSIEMKQDQVQKLKDMLKQKPNNKCLKEELDNLRESLDNDRKAFEDLEFQYLEGESEWHAQRDELHTEEIKLLKLIEETKLGIVSLENQENNSASESQKNLRKRLVSLLNDLQDCEKKFQELEQKLATKINVNKSGDSTSSLSIMSQSLFGSTEILCPKANHEDMMSKSFNENMIYNNKIEMPKNSLQIVVTANNNGRVVSQEFVGRGSCVSSKEASDKIFDSIREIERNRKLLTSKQGQKALEEERRKIEEILSKLGSGTQTRQQHIQFLNTADEVQTTFRENKENQTHKQNSKIAYEKQTSEPPFAVQQMSHQHLFEKQNSAPSHAQRPLSESNSEAGEDFMLSTKRKSINEPSTRTQSPASPRSLSIEKRCSSGLSNETSSRADSCLSSEGRKMMAKHQRPLTRYLPIFAHDLDLRRHIESAGHQISMCPHVFIDAYTCRGYLHKLGSTFHTWSKRWFVLDRQRKALIYYSDKSERKPRGGAYFSSIDEVYMDHLNASKSSRPHCTFIVKTKKRKYYLQAASDAASRIWIDAIITGAQGNVDY